MPTPDYDPRNPIRDVIDADRFHIPDTPAHAVVDRHPGGDLGLFRIFHAILVLDVSRCARYGRRGLHERQVGFGPATPANHKQVALVESRGHLPMVWHRTEMLPVEERKGLEIRGPQG